MNTNEQKEIRMHTQESLPALGYRMVGTRGASWVPASGVTSGMVTALGIALRVDRCAPEHGGGILVTTPTGNYQLGSDSIVLVIGMLSAVMLSIVIREYGDDSHDYTTGALR